MDTSILEMLESADNSGVGVIVGAAIRRARTTKKMKQEDLAKLLGVARQTVAGWEKNASSMPLVQMMRVFDALKVPLNDYPIFKSNLLLVDEKPHHTDQKIMPGIKAYFKSFSLRNSVEELLSYIDYLSPSELSLLISMASNMATREQEVSSAYARGAIDSAVYIGLADANKRNGFAEGEAQFEDYYLRTLEAAQEDLTAHKSDYDDLGAESISLDCALKIAQEVSDRQYDFDVESGYTSARNEHGNDNGDWDDHL